MTDEPEPQKTWLGKLSQAFSREPQTQEQLIELLRHATERHLLENEALKMIEGVLQVSKMQVRDIMIPRHQMVVVEASATPEQATPIVIESTHSRFPVTGDSRDEIIGILLAKDLLPYKLTEEPQNLTIRDFIRPATFIPESKRLDILLEEFRLNRNHMAIVVDEYGGIAGLITIEDVLEQIVGEIEDEYDTIAEEQPIRQLSDTEYLVKAITPIEDFNAYFGTDYKHDDFDTIGGVVLKKFSHLPKRDESTQLDGYRVTVIQASSRGIQLLRFKKLEGESAE